MKYWRVYWLALHYSPHSQQTGIHQFFSNFHSYKDSDGLPLTHNSTEETPHDRTPPQLHTRRAFQPLETL